MYKRALISTSDKTGLLPLAKALMAVGCRIVSTGGTAKFLRDGGIDIIDVAEQTGFPEVMDGRVRTLHPKIHMALLARAENQEDQKLLKEHAIEPFDLVVVNLYPFESARKQGLSEVDLVEEIDIGGPALLRASAKSYDRITVVCDPIDYQMVSEFTLGKADISIGQRKALAAKVFAHTSRYDDLIAKTFATEESWPRTLTGRLESAMRYGENPQQVAEWYSRPELPLGLHQANILHGKALSYNNLLDLDAALRAVIEFTDPAVVAVKHTNPCGVGTGPDAVTAMSRALSADPVSVFGGIVASNLPIDIESARLLSGIFLECVLAPGFSLEALELLKKKKDLRLLAWPELTKFQPGLEFRAIAGGFLTQTPDRLRSTQSKWTEWKILGEKPSSSILADINLAWTVCAHLKSNSIAITYQGQSVGLGMGQVNRVDSVAQAIQRMHQSHVNIDKSQVVLASDAFFPFSDSMDLIAKAGLRWVVQPGGSIRDHEVFARAAQLGVNMLITGERHFRH
jgi:phosphoribosylaminoimidazolecarboxamide formyltransferase / IMP cyclohydrolase